MLRVFGFFVDHVIGTLIVVLASLTWLVMRIGMLNADPSIQFSNSTDVVTVAGVTAAATSSLSGPALTGFRALAGTGLSSHATFNSGIFWAF